LLRVSHFPLILILDQHSQLLPYSDPTPIRCPLKPRSRSLNTSFKTKQSQQVIQSFHRFPGWVIWLCSKFQAFDTLWVSVANMFWHGQGVRRHHCSCVRQCLGRFVLLWTYNLICRCTLTQRVSAKLLSATAMGCVWIFRVSEISGTAIVFYHITAQILSITQCRLSLELNLHPFVPRYCFSTICLRSKT